MMRERGVEVDPSTIMRWVHRHAPELEKRVRWYQGYRTTSWRVDKTYVKVGGKCKYLFRDVDKHGSLIDFMLMDRRNTRAAHRFLDKALTTMRHSPPCVWQLTLGSSSLLVDHDWYFAWRSGHSRNVACSGDLRQKPMKHRTLLRMPVKWYWIS
jgi:transposase-like protein